ncbi:MAG TPA: DUF3857 domain-containing protein [Thermoanaerobaculia bacterium]
MRSTLLLLVALTLPAFAGEVGVRPAPSWVETLPADTSLAIAKQNVRWGIYDILSDHQVIAGGADETKYFRVVRKVLSPSGVQNASEVSLDFDPSFERLTVHGVTIIRNGTRIDALEPDEIRVIDKEDDTENRIYDGERTALLFLKDVRPGDVIDYSWSIAGGNPILHGRYTDDFDLSTAVPTKRLRHRLVWPIGRPLQWGAEHPTIAMKNGAQELVWERADVPAIDIEDVLPSWFEPWKSVQLTEFASWKEVAAWANAMFQLDERSQREVSALATRIKSENASRDARITAAIRFVQDDVRYLGIEMGRSSHEPHQPWETLEQRWGDCKDKTLLLVSLLRELGVEAYPALVNTRLQRRLDEKLPSPFLFDHVITQVIDGGKTYWIDGTIADQGGSLATIETPSDERALIVRDNTNALTNVVTNDKGSIVVEQTYTTTDYTKPVVLNVKTTWSGSDADSVRAELATLSIEDFAQERINQLAIDQPKIEAVRAPSIVDDRARNIVVVLEEYRIPELWKNGDWSWYPRVIESYLSRPDTMIRSMPLAFPYPLNIRQTVTFNLPEDVDVEESSSVTETPAFRYESVLDSNGKTITIRQSLRGLRDAVAAKDVPDHLTKLSEVWSTIGFHLEPEGAQPKAAESAAGLPQWGIGLFVVGVFVAMCVWLATGKRKGPAPAIVRQRFAFAPGESPSSALTIARADDIDSHLAELACACGATRYSAPDVQRALYAEREMTIVTRLCGSCGREQSIYFTAA